MNHADPEKAVAESAEESRAMEGAEKTPRGSGSYCMTKMHEIAQQCLLSASRSHTILPAKYMPRA